MDIIQVRKIITFKKLFVINCLSKRDLQAEHTEHSINKNLVILKLRNLVDTSYDFKKKMLMIKNHLTRSKFLQSAILRHLPFQWGIILSDVNKISNALHSTNLVQQDSSCYYSLLCTKKFNISLYFEICVLKPKVGLSYKNLTLFTGIGSISMTDQSDDEFDHDDLVERKVGIERCQVIALALR